MNLKLILDLIFLYCLINPSAAAAPSMAMPGCNETCGNVSIPYPFGMGNKRCYLDEWYEVTCNHSAHTDKPFLSKFNLEVLQISIEGRILRLNIPIASNCPGKEVSTSVWRSTNFSGSPFSFYSGRNEFTVVGCDNALLTYNNEIQAGCTSTCGQSKYTSSKTLCYGINCCQTSLPYNGNGSVDLDFYSIKINGATTKNCTYAFLAEKFLITNISSDRSSDPLVFGNMTHAPVAVSWLPPTHIGENEIKEGSFLDYYCEKYDLRYYYCECGFGYRGNPYIPDGCKVVEECINCEKECNYRSGPRGDLEFFCNRKHKIEIILGSSFGGGITMLLLCGVCFWLYKFIKKRRIMKLKMKFFKRNGGLLLQQQLSSDEGTVEKTKIFTSKELEKATDNFNTNRILGQGGLGTVYKGMLSDGKTIAIKKSKMVNDGLELEQFINEVVILSKINHRNIVKLFGCCLETEVPLLVYEFIPNGNLFQLIQDYTEEFQFSWKMRLQVAIEVAEALAYLHSACSMTIFHRDIKSTNILLDEKYRAKVADFGTSRSIAIEQTHLTTLVHGTFGYLDPEYFQSSKFTEKSDVYSYGVVLVELLTGQKPISSIRSEEERSLATRFLVSLKEKRLFELLDPSIVKEACEEEINAFAYIAKRCLGLNGKKRPAMREVMMELEGIKMGHFMSLNVPVDNFNDGESIIKMNAPLEDGSTSAPPNLVRKRAFSDIDPFLLDTI